MTGAGGGLHPLATYPDSPLKSQMAYYIEPAEQTEEVKAQLAAITPDSLNPEELTLIDPACGSGHILVEAYELFKAIYLERGYRQRDVARLILEKNLFGLDIDGRAAQLSGFALMMKGRADDRRLLERGVRLNVMAFEEVVGDEWRVVSEEVGKLTSEEGIAEAVHELVELFRHARTFGSLIQVPAGLAAKLPELKRLCETESQDLFVSEALKRLRPLVRQAELLAAQYDAVVANPPYMSSRTGMYPQMREFVRINYPAGKADLFSCFIERGWTLARETALSALVTRQSWMFLSSWEDLRKRLLAEKTLVSMTHLGSGAFDSISGDVVQTTAFVIRNATPLSAKPTVARLVKGGEKEKQNSFLDSEFQFTRLSQQTLQQLPGSPLAYWISNGFVKVFLESDSLGSVAEARQGLSTGDNDLFLRRWHEVEQQKIGFGCNGRAAAHGSDCTWFPYNKGGIFRKWYGNHEFVIRFDPKSYRALKQQGNKCPSEAFYFREAVSWSDITSETNAFRFYPGGFIHDGVGHSAFGGDAEWKASLLAYCNTKYLQEAAKVLSPTLHFDVGYFNKLPFARKVWNLDTIRIGRKAVAEATADWNAYERSWNFQSLPILSGEWRATSDEKKQLTTRHSLLATSYTAWTAQNRQTIAEMKRLEEENSRLFIDAYGLQDELTPDVPIEQITLTVNPAYRYGKKLTDDEWSVEHGFGEELETRFREDTMRELVSYAIGCMMGRYSLDEPGLIYAHSGNQGFDPSRYARFPADADGILPITDTDWFDQDAAHRLVEFIAVAWPGEVASDEWRVASGEEVASEETCSSTHHSSLTTKKLTTHHSSLLEENLSFLAANLSPKNGETSRDTLRRYLSDRFFKDHLQTYKNRPIYWCFSSGKQKAFQCLVYLHRYHSGTLARMRMEYVVPLQSKMAARLDSLADDIQAAGSSAQAKRLQKERDKLTRQLEELRRFDEQLRHHADQRIALDLDDGVKVNYAKFGDLLAEVKTVTGVRSE